MTVFATRQLPDEPDAVAPDGSIVRVLLGLTGGSTAEFSLESNEIAIAVRHRTVEEIWFVTHGSGRMWRASDEIAELEVELHAGTCLTIPTGTEFQFRSGDFGLRILGVTLPPWPLDRIEAVRASRQRWSPTVVAGPGLGERDD